MREEERRQRVQRNADALWSTVMIIADLTLLTVGPGETEEYEHIDLDRRCVEMAIFYFWWVANLLLDAIDYKWTQDFADAVVLGLAGVYPGIQAVLPARWLEYEGADPSASMGAKAALAAQRVLHHIDPETPVSQEFARDLATEGTRVATEWFHARTAWI